MNKWRRLLRLFEKMGTVGWDKIWVDKKLPFRSDKGDEVFMWMPRNADNFRVIIT